MNITFIVRYNSCIFASRISTAHGAVISLSYRPQAAHVMNVNVRQQSEQTTTLPARACVTRRMGEFMLGNSSMKLPDINYVGTC